MTTIVQLNCLESWSQEIKNESIDPSFFTGGYVTASYYDSVYISIDELKVANAKMVELKYQKEIANRLRTQLENDSIIICDLHKDISNKTKEIKKLKQQRNTIGIAGIIGIIIAAFVL